jgi:hypothetical protein
MFSRASRRFARAAAVVASAGAASLAAPVCAPDAKAPRAEPAAASPFFSGLFGGAVNYSAAAQSIADILDNNDYDDGVRAGRSRAQT